MRGDPSHGWGEKCARGLTNEAHTSPRPANTTIERGLRVTLTGSWIASIRESKIERLRKRDCPAPCHDSPTLA